MLYLPYILILIICGQLGLVLWQQPGYGQADDGTLLKICANPDNLTLWQSFSQFVIEDKNWGMFRPLYFWMIQGLYCTTKFQPAWLYFFNTIFVFSIFALLAAALIRTLPEDRKKLSLINFISLFLLLTLCVYRTHDIFSTPALQEKLVLLAGALSIYIFTLGREKVIWLFLPISLLIGFSTKAQFLIFLPGLFLLLIMKKRSASLHIYFLIFALLGMGLVKWIAGQGSYTNRYSLSNVISNLSSRQALLLLALAFISIIFEFRKNLKAKKFSDLLNFPALGQTFFPASFIFAFLAIMSPWKIDDSYLLVSVAPFVAFAIIRILLFYPLEKWRPLFIPICILAASLTFYRGYRAFARYGDLQTILFSDQMNEIVSKPHLLVVSCAEGSEHVKTYLRFHSGKSLLTTIQYNEPLNAKRAIYVLADTALCPLQPDLIKRVEAVSHPRFSGSFILYKLVR